MQFRTLDEFRRKKIVEELKMGLIPQSTLMRSREEILADFVSGKLFSLGFQPNPIIPNWLRIILEQSRMSNSTLQTIEECMVEQEITPQRNQAIIDLYNSEAKDTSYLYLLELFLFYDKILSERVEGSKREVADHDTLSSFYKLVSTSLMSSAIPTEEVAFIMSSIESGQLRDRPKIMALLSSRGSGILLNIILRIFSLLHSSITSTR